MLLFLLSVLSLLSFNGGISILEEDTELKKGKCGLSSGPVHVYFDEFQRAYGKTYNTQEEKQLRLKIFTENLKSIDELNASGEGTAVFGIDEFADLSPVEFKMVINGIAGNLSLASLSVSFPPESKARLFRRTKDDKKKGKDDKGNKTPDKPNGKSDNSTKTPEFKCRDWTYPTNKFMTPVKNSGSCIASWAMAPVDCIEIAYSAKNSNVTALSAQQVVDCSNSNGCAEPARISAWEGYFTKPGLVKESDYPWVGAKNNNICGLKKEMKVVARVTQIVNCYTDADIIKALASYPVAATINPAGFKSYKSGILALDKSQCDTEPEAVTNLVTIVGCGSEVGKDGKLTNYWVVKNNIGDKWGDKGYMKIKPGVCGIAVHSFYFKI